MNTFKYILFASMLATSMNAAAQETYQDAKLASSQLTGTARYVGMGGAMEALGADISTISSNPAGIGLLRKSVVSVSAGVVAQTDAKTTVSLDNNFLSLNDASKSKPSFDQIGLVWAGNVSRDSGIRLNVGFNYHKSTNFSQILTAANYLNGASQSRWAAAKTAYSQYLEDKYGKGTGDQVWNAVDENYYSLMGKGEDGSQNYYQGQLYTFGQYQKGYIGDYDFGMSVAFNNRVWVGLTVGIHDVHYKSQSGYREVYVADEDAFSDSQEELKITGTGFDVKAGVIVRPIEDSPFRMGAYVNSPIFYDLKMSGYSALSIVDRNMIGDDGKPAHGEVANNASLDFRLNTPWKAGLSLGHTIGSNIALGATYEYAWYDHMDNRVKNSGYYDYWTDSYYDSSSSDKDMNDHTRNSLKGVSTVKLGLEYKPISMLAVRLGYNYVSPMFKESADRDQTIASQGTVYATSTDYTNWKAINRITAGLGFNYQNLAIDVAYQYSCQKGDFYPFAGWAEQDAPASPATQVKNNRHQILMTVGYKF